MSHRLAGATHSTDGSIEITVHQITVGPDVFPPGSLMLKTRGCAGATTPEAPGNKYNGYPRVPAELVGASHGFENSKIAKYVPGVVQECLAVLTVFFTRP